MDKEETNDQSSPLDNVNLEKLTKEKVLELLEEGKRFAKEFKESRYQPTVRGEYDHDLPNGLRGGLTDKTCKLCDGKNKIEKVYELKVFNSPLGAHHRKQKAWVFSNYRCSNCRIVYDFR